MSIFSVHPVWLHQTRIGLSLYDVAGQGYLRESVSIELQNTVFTLLPKSSAASGGIIAWQWNCCDYLTLFIICRIWRTTSWSWYPLCLSWTDLRSLSTLSTSALLFASSFSSSTHCEPVRPEPHVHIYFYYKMFNDTCQKIVLAIFHLQLLKVENHVCREHVWFVWL